jgi:NAD(P)-dependent dehydrogenase (short-subunit alcohol dehydrogenase family)
MSRTVVITGVSRGIGLSFCKHYHALGDRVYGVCRVPSDALTQLGVTVISGVDVGSPAAMPKLAEALSGVSIDLLINNAGVLNDEVLGHLNFDTIEQQFQVNALGPLRVTETLLSQLNDGAKIANITSRMGSVEDNTSGGRYGYRMSKAALNIASMSLARDLAPRGIAVAILHPGLVGTEMIGGYGDITPDEAAKRLSQRIEELSMETSGMFRHSNGEHLPW